MQPRRQTSILRESRQLGGIVAVQLLRKQDVMHCCAIERMKGHVVYDCHFAVHAVCKSQPSAAVCDE